jgi:hypothetical protein
VATPATTDIVDWVLVEIKNTAGNLVARRSVFVREDGQIVDLDGVSPVTLYGIGGGLYYITVKHRNHLGLSTQNSLFFSHTAMGVTPPAPKTFDFTTAPDANIFGDANAFKIIDGINVMICGDANRNTNIRYGGLENDRGVILTYIGAVNTAVIGGVYVPQDVNLDGLVRYGGLNNDRAYFLGNALSGVATSVLVEQVR